MPNAVLIDRSSYGAADVPTRAREAGGQRPQQLARERLDSALDRIDALEAEALQLRHQVALLQRAAVRTRQYALHDELTGLPNRRLLLDRYRQASALTQRQPRLLALLFIDLDGFKAINDTRGHAAGDAVLQQVAERLRACIRTSDTACRLGGDEFVVLLPGLAEPASAVAVAAKIRARLAEPFVVGEATVDVAASIGMAIHGVDGRDYAELLRAADAAMYREKGRGAGRSAQAPSRHPHPPAPPFDAVKGAKRPAPCAANADCVDR
jgi:diguanylate cyclase (GGDEF)-like protein